MILVRSKTLVFVLFFSICMALAASIWAYSVGSAAGLKSGAETALFLGLTTAIVELILAFILFAGGRRKRRELDTLAELARYGGSIPDTRLARFGALGKGIRSILRELSETSERRGERVAALNGILRSTLEFVDKPILLVGLDGRLLELSRGAKAYPRLAEAAPSSLTIESALVDIDFKSIFQEAERTHMAVERKGEAMFYPVYSIRGDMCAIIADLSRSSVSDLLTDLKERAKKAAAESRDAMAAKAKKEGRGILGFLRNRLEKKPKAAEEK